MNGSLPTVGLRPTVSCISLGYMAFQKLFHQKSKICLTFLCAIVQSRAVERWLHRTTSNLLLNSQSSMKIPHWFIGSNSLLSYLRITIAGSLVIAAAALGYTAVKVSSPTLLGESRAPFAGKITSQDLAGKGGEPDAGGINRAAQEAYRHRAYPSANIRIADTRNAQKAWAKIKGKSAAAGVNAQGQWTLVGPSIASYPGTLSFTGHDYIASGRTTALAIAPNCSQAKCRLYLGAA